MSRPSSPIMGYSLRGWNISEYDKLNPVGSPAMAEIDNKMTPIIAELMTLGPGNDQHPTVKQLFNWFVDPKCTVEEFNYIIGALEPYVCDIMEDHFNLYTSRESCGDCVYMRKVAAEALAVRCPVLEGPWETAAWFVIDSMEEYQSSIFGFASRHFSDWIISVIGNPDLCLSSYLRFQLIKLFQCVVDPNDHNKMQALDSVMYACSTLNMKYLLTSRMVVHNLTDYLKMFDCEFDKQLAVRLHNDLNSRLSIILHDVAHYHSVHPIIYKEPREFHALNDLLKTSSDCIHAYDLDGDFQGCIVNDITYMIRMLFKSFKFSLRTPQLVNVAALCVMDLVEFVLLVNANLQSEERLMDIDFASLINTNRLLEELCDDNDTALFTSHVGRTLFSRFSDGRLKNLRIKVGDIQLTGLPMIYNLLHNGNSIDDS